MIGREADHCDYLRRLSTARTQLSETASGWDTEVVRTYNSLSLTQEVQTVSGAPASFTVKTASGTASGYDAGGRRVHLEYPNDADLDATGSSSVRRLDFVYDGNDRLESIAESGVGPLASYEYAGPGSRVRRVDLYGAVGNPSLEVLEKTVSYDYLNRPETTTYAYGSSSQTLVSYTETWGDGSFLDSGAHRVGVFQRKSFSKSMWGSSRREYVYDALERLTSGTRDGVSESYLYDPANNRTQKTVGTTTTYGHNAANEVTSVSTLAGVAHDPRGNLSHKDHGTWTEDYTHDVYNRLAAYVNSSSGETWKYHYDGLGRRVRKDLWVGGSQGGDTRYFLYDGARCIVELRETQSGTEVREYIHGVGIDEVVVEYLPDGNPASQTGFWPLVDSLGNVRDLADLTGTSTRRLRVAYDYTPYGELTQETQADPQNPILQEVLFTGRRLDRESGLYYYRARQYDPQLGRFLERDPIGVWGDGVGRGNGYVYAALDSVNGVDPTGLYERARGYEDCCEVFEDLERILRFIEDIKHDARAARNARKRGRRRQRKDPHNPNPAPPKDAGYERNRRDGCKKLRDAVECILMFAGYDPSGSQANVDKYLWLALDVLEKFCEGGPPPPSPEPPPCPDPVPEPPPPVPVPVPPVPEPVRPVPSPEPGPGPSLRPKPWWPAGGWIPGLILPEIPFLIIPRDFILPPVPEPSGGDVAVMVRKNESDFAPRVGEASVGYRAVASCSQGDASDCVG